MAEEQTPGVQDPTTQTPGGAPWAQSLNSLFPDEAVRGQVDNFLRSEVQPYITRVEQQAAGRNTDAEHLWDELQNNSVATYVKMTEELFGEAAAGTVLETLQRALNGDTGAQQQVATQMEQVQQAATQQEQVQQVQQVQQVTPTTDPRVEQMLNSWEQTEAERQYASDIELTKQNNPDLDPAMLEEFIHPWVVVANGDFAKAAGLYRNYISRFGAPATTDQIAGANTAAENRQQATPGFVPQAPTAPAPPVSGQGQNGSIPTVKKAQTLDDAYSRLGEMLAASNEAPPVGGV